MRCVVVLLLVSGCVPVYDAQLNDRREELEEHRETFLGPDERVQLKAAAKSRFYWIGLDPVLDDKLLKSFDATTGETITYDIDLGGFGIEERLVYGDDIVAICPGSGAKSAYDAHIESSIPAQTVDIPDPDGQSFQGGTCQVAGNVVYFVRNDVLFEWIPPSQTPATLVDLTTTMIGEDSVSGFAIAGQRMVFLEGRRLWMIEDIHSPGQITAVFLNNDNPPEGSVVINDRGVLYHTGVSNGHFFVDFETLSTTDLTNAVEHGGYRINAVHDSVQLMEDREDNVLFGDQVVYRGEGGIFAYGLDTGKVQDILLDSEDVRYFDPVVLETGELYVEQRNFSSDVTIFTVQLNEVLR